MYRFKSSKYKNAAPKVPQKEGWVSDINVGAPQSFGNHIKCSAAFKAFNVDNRGGGCLGLLPLNDAGKKTRGVPLLHAHAEFVTDFDFCAYDDGLLATCSHDAYVKIWRIPSALLTETTQTNAPVDPLVTLKPSSGVCRLETISWNPVVDCVLASSANNKVVLWDIAKAKEISTNSYHEELVQSVSWKADGSKLVSTGRDKKIRIWDPRSQDSAMVAEGHANNRDSRVVWIGNTDHVLSTGLGSNRERQVFLRDIRSLGSPVKEYNGDSSLGIYLPLYDLDTNMLFLVAKGDITVNFWEVDISKEPYLYECSKYLADVQTKGACLVPKRALNVMEGEVNRIQILTKDSIVPISYHVPRKTYRDFHPDIFPDTRAPVPMTTTNDWLAGKPSSKVALLNLDPSKRTKDLIRFEHDIGSGVPSHWLATDGSGGGVTETDGNRGSSIIRKDSEPLKERNKFTRQQTVAVDKPTLAPKPAPRTKLTPAKSVDESSNNKLNIEHSNGRNNQPLDNKLKRQPSKGSGFKVRVSKYRHLNGNLGTRETQISNLPALCKTIPGESEGFRANSTRVAIPLATSGGHLAILEVAKRGRLTPGVLPSLICGSNIMDFTWDPFDDSRIAIACDDGRIRVWSIPEKGLTESLTQPDFELKGHKDKVTLLKFHPSAKDIMASASQDLSILVWDLDQQTHVYELEGHTDQIFSMAWHPDGNLLATVCKDQQVRVFDPRKSSEPLNTGAGPSGTRGARICWVLGGSHLVTSGFHKGCERQITLYDALSNNLQQIHTEGIDVSPAILIPFYDEDSSTLFLTGKGDTTIFCFEVLAEPPNFFPLSHFKCPGPHQSVSFLHKNACNVAQVEFATCFRLTTATVEPLAFKVPRLRSEFFQDDLFPDTRVTWKPTMTSKQFTDLCGKTPARVSLRPVQMSQLSDAPELVRPPPRFAANENRVSAYLEDSDGGNKMMDQDLLIASMKHRVQYADDEDDELPQDRMQGAEENEWSE